jgi:hypothetical protein
MTVVDVAGVIIEIVGLLLMIGLVATTQKRKRGRPPR